MYSSTLCYVLLYQRIQCQCSASWGCRKHAVKQIHATLGVGSSSGDAWTGTCAVSRPSAAGRWREICCWVWWEGRREWKEGLWEGEGRAGGRSGLGRGRIRWGLLCPTLTPLSRQLALLNCLDFCQIYSWHIYLYLCVKHFHLTFPPSKGDSKQLTKWNKATEPSLQNKHETATSLKQHRTEEHQH